MIQIRTYAYLEGAVICRSGKVYCHSSHPKIKIFVSFFQYIISFSIFETNENLCDDMKCELQDR